MSFHKQLRQKLNIYFFLRLLLLGLSLQNAAVSLDPAVIFSLSLQPPNINLPLWTLALYFLGFLSMIKPHSFLTYFVLLFYLQRTYSFHNWRIFALLGYYTALIGSKLPMFQDNQLVPSSRVKKTKMSSCTALSLKTGLTGHPETMITNYQSTMCNIPQDQSPHLLCSKSLKSQ